jgi:hypothetical protein
LAVVEVAGRVDNSGVTGFGLPGSPEGRRFSIMPEVNRRISVSTILTE